MQGPHTCRPCPRCSTAQRIPRRAQLSAPTHAQAQQGQQGQGPAQAYGLLGLLGVINMNDADVTTLALGTDLTSLGLHLNGMDALYPTFASPWADGPVKPEPAFKARPVTTPACPANTPKPPTPSKPQTLASLGLHLSGTDALYPAFASPRADGLVTPWSA